MCQREALGTVASADAIRATSGFGPAHPIAVFIYPEINTRLQEFTGGAWELQDTSAGLVAPTTGRVPGEARPAAP